MFKSIATDPSDARRFRERNAKQALRYGVEFLDAALRGIFIDDLVLVGASSGAGKTQFCMNVALACAEDGFRCHYMALEAGLYEISQRIKFKLTMERYYADPDRPRLGFISQATWLAGEHLAGLRKYEEQAEDFMAKAYDKLFVLYKNDSFTVEDLIQQVTFCADDTDLIIIDHVHYFDWEDLNDNRAIKEIAKTVRNLALTYQKPIVLVAQLRKRDKNNAELVPGIDEFHGSSDLSKIATRVITLAPGQPTSDGRIETFFRVCKNRFDGGVTRYAGREIFNPKSGTYDPGMYKLCWPSVSKFEHIAREYYPRWATFRD